MGRLAGLYPTGRLAADVDRVLERIARSHLQCHAGAAVSTECPLGTVCRQRQNLGRTRSRGVEVELRYTPTRAWMFWASYLYNESTVRDFPADPSLEGKRVPQVPKNMYTLGVQYLNPRLVNAAIIGRFVGNQFEDDRNENRAQELFCRQRESLATDSPAACHGLAGSFSVWKISSTRHTRWGRPRHRPRYYWGPPGWCTAASGFDSEGHT